MCEGAPLTSVEAEMGRFELRDCDKMVVAQFHHLSHITFCDSCSFFSLFLCSRRPPQKTKRRTARHSSPQTPPAVPSDTTFLRLRPKRKQCREATPHFIQEKITPADFQRKMFELQVKTSAISRKIQNRSKSHHRKPQMEGDTAFLP